MARTSAAHGLQPAGAGLPPVLQWAWKRQWGDFTPQECNLGHKHWKIAPEAVPLNWVPSCSWPTLGLNYKNPPESRSKNLGNWCCIHAKNSLKNIDMICIHCVALDRRWLSFAFKALDSAPCLSFRISCCTTAQRKVNKRVASSVFHHNLSGSHVHLNVKLTCIACRQCMILSFDKR